MIVGFSEAEYQRVRPWMIAGIAPNPVFTEAGLDRNIRDGNWLLITTENAGCALEFFTDENGEKAANVILIGGRIGGSLREIMVAHEAICTALKTMGFSYICGTPKPSFHKYLEKYGFEKAGKEFIKRL